MPRKPPKARRTRASRPEPLIIGVTGHRDFGKRGEKVEALVAGELERIGRAHGSAPVVVLSALAEGADRLVARLARKMLGARLIAILPMPAKAYEMDFAKAASRREFARHLGTADRVVKAPVLSKGRKWRAYTEERNHQYAWGGAYVARNVDILLTVWDGKPARGTGGTAHVVDWFLQGSTPRRYAMSRWRLRSGPSPYAARLVHINPETLAVRRRRAAR